MIIKKIKKFINIKINLLIQLTPNFIQINIPFAYFITIIYKNIILIKVFIKFNNILINIFILRMNRIVNISLILM